MAFAAKVDLLEKKVTDTERKLNDICKWIQRNFGDDPTIVSGNQVDVVLDNASPTLSSLLNQNHQPRPKKPKFQYERKRKLENNNPLQIPNKVIGISIRDEANQTPSPRIPTIIRNKPMLKTLDLRDEQMEDGDPLNLLIPEIVMKDEPKPEVVVVDLEEEETKADKVQTARDGIFLVDLQGLIGSKQNQPPSSSKSKVTSTPPLNSTPRTYSKPGPKSKCQPLVLAIAPTPPTPTYKPGPKSRCQHDQPNTPVPRPKVGPKSRISQQPRPPTPSTSGVLAQSIKVAAIQVPTRLTTSTENSTSSNSDSEIIMVDESEILNSCKSLDSIQPSIDPVPRSVIDYFLRQEMNGLADNTTNKNAGSISKQVQKAQVNPICNESLDSGRFDLKNHIVLHHTEEFQEQEPDDFTESVCQECGRKFTSLYNFRCHQHIAHSYPYDDN